MSSTVGVAREFGALGIQFLAGREVEQNVVLGYACSRIAVLGGDSSAINNLGRIVLRLTPVQRAEGDEIVRSVLDGGTLPAATRAGGQLQDLDFENVKAFFQPLREAGRLQSLGDLSCIELLCKEPTATLLTSQGSPNDRLFLGLADVAWAIRDHENERELAQSAAPKPMATAIANRIGRLFRGAKDKAVLIPDALGLRGMMNASETP